MSSQRPAPTSSLPITSSEAFDSLRPEWEALHARVHGATIFTHPGWVEAWLRHFGGHAMPVYLAVRRDDELVAVAPFDMDPSASRLLGDPNLSDFGPAIAESGDEAFAARGILEWLNEDMAPSASLWGLPATSPLASEVQAQATNFGWDATVEHEAVTPACELPSSFEGYLDALRKKERHEIRRKMRHADEAGALAFEEATTPGAVTGQLDQFFALMRESHPGKATFLTSETIAFLRDVATLGASLGCLRLGTLRLDGNVLAMTWCFENEEETFLYNSGYATGTELSPGIVSKAHAIASAIDRGKRRFNFLRGEEDYKRRMGGHPGEVVRIALRHR